MTSEVPIAGVVASPVVKRPGTPLPYVALEHVESGVGRLVQDAEIGERDPSDAARFETGDVLFGKLRPYLHKVVHPRFDGCCSTELLVLRPRSGLDERFLYYVALSAPFVAWADASSYGTKMPRTSWELLRRFRLSLPPVRAQIGIAEFLDRETKRIDQLMEKKQRLIDLLEEKRTTLISQSVTKGLDPTVPMKDSGVAWLGDIPAHWDATKIKFVARPGTGHTPSRQHPEYWENCTVPWFTLADVWQLRDGWTEVVTETSENVSEVGLANSSAVKHTAQTVFFSRTASVGFSGIMGTDMATSQDFITWTCSGRIDPNYLLYIFRAMRQEFARLTMGSTHKTIYMPNALAVAGPLPPKSEQIEIIESIRPRHSALRDAIQKLHLQLDKLTEYRQALITAAVTGQIDVTTEGPKPEEAIG